jgi:hypothetical protein
MISLESCRLSSSHIGLETKPAIPRIPEIYRPKATFELTRIDRETPAIYEGLPSLIVSVHNPGDHSTKSPTNQHIKVEQQSSAVRAEFY